MARGRRKASEDVPVSYLLDEIQTFQKEVKEDFKRVWERLDLMGERLASLETSIKANGGLNSRVKRLENQISDPPKNNQRTEFLLNLFWKVALGVAALSISIFEIIVRVQGLTR